MKTTLLVGSLVLLAACGGTSEIDGPGDIDPGDLPPAGEAAATLQTETARHDVYAEPDGCVVHGLSVAGFETRYHRSCTWNELNYARVVGRCFYDPARAGEAAIGCDAMVEPVVVGLLPPPIAHLCLGTFAGPPTRIVDAEVITPPPAVPFVARLPFPTEGSVLPIPFTASGYFYGEPEIDTDVDLMIAKCTAAGPWEAPPAEEVLLVTVAGPADLDEITVFLDFGLGPLGFSIPDALGDGGPFDFRLDPAATTFRAAIGEEGEWVELPLPADIGAGEAVIVIPASLDPREIVLRSG